MSININFSSLSVSEMDSRLLVETTSSFLAGYTILFYSNTLLNRVKISPITSELHDQLS